MNLTKVASLPGSGGGALSWQPPEVWAKPAPPKAKLPPGWPYMDLVVEPRKTGKVRKYLPGDDEPTPVTPVAKWNNKPLSAMSETQLREALAICQERLAKYGPMDRVPRDGFTASRWIPKLVNALEEFF